MCDFTEQTPYIAELRAARTANPSPAPASPSRDALPIPSPGLAVAGTFSTATCSRQVTPSPADPAARGTYSEEIA